MKTPLATTAVAAILASVSALAADTASQGQMSTEMGTTSSAQAADFSQLDTDNNGAISPSEAASRPNLTKNWSKIDENEDGQVDRAEFSAFEKQDTQGSEKKPGSDY